MKKIQVTMSETTSEKMAFVHEFSGARPCEIFEVAVGQAFDFVAAEVERRRAEITTQLEAQYDADKAARAKGIHVDVHTGDITVPVEALELPPTFEEEPIRLPSGAVVSVESEGSVEYAGVTLEAVVE